MIASSRDQHARADRNNGILRETLRRPACGEGELVTVEDDLHGSSFSLPGVPARTRGHTPRRRSRRQGLFSFRTLCSFRLGLSNRVQVRVHSQPGQGDNIPSLMTVAEHVPRHLGQQPQQALPRVLAAEVIVCRHFSFRLTREENFRGKNDGPGFQIRTEGSRTPRQSWAADEIHPSSSTSGIYLCHRG